MFIFSMFQNFSYIWRISRSLERFLERKYPKKRVVRASMGRKYNSYTLLVIFRPFRKKEDFFAELVVSNEFSDPPRPLGPPIVNYRTVKCK